MKLSILSRFHVMVFAISPLSIMQVSGEPLRINQIQVLGTHNSYSLPIAPGLCDFLNARQAAGLQSIPWDMFPPSTFEYHPVFQQYLPENHPLYVGTYPDLSYCDYVSYSFPDFPAQLDYGLRSLELDLYDDPEGGRFANPAGLAYYKDGEEEIYGIDREGLMKPGFKMFHVADEDFRSHYTSLVDGLKAIKTWSDANSDHVPIFIMIETKNGDSCGNFPDTCSEVLPWTAEAFNRLDAAILSVLGSDRIITPDDVIGSYPTLREAVLAHNWPLLDESRGKVIFFLLPGNLEANSNREEAYLEGHPSGRGRVMFPFAYGTTPTGPDGPKTDQDHAAVFLYDNPNWRDEVGDRYDFIQDLVAQGFMVRTRADIETLQAAINDRTQAMFAINSGAQVISTDYYAPGMADYYNSSYVVEFPGGPENTYLVNFANTNVESLQLAECPDGSIGEKPTKHKKEKKKGYNNEKVSKVQKEDRR